MGKTLLVISGGVEAVPGIQHAISMGHHVVVSDYNPQAPGFAYAHDHLLASTYDVAETIAAATEYHQNRRAIEGVICMAADVPLTVARVAESLGLPGLSIETAQLAADKLAMKRLFAAQGIAIPWFCEVKSAQHLVTLMVEHGPDLVIKPVDSRGARGVLQLQGVGDLNGAFQQAKSESPSGRVMVEKFQPGPQISTESILVNGCAVTPGFIDRNYEHLERFSPYIIENGGHQPSTLTVEQRRQVVELAEQAARAMGIKNGIAKGDMVLTPQGPKVIEIAARLSGGWMSSDQIPVATGVDMVGAAIKLALGEALSLDEYQPSRYGGMAIRYFFPPPGRLRAIHNIEQVEALPWVYRLGFFVSPGDDVGEMTDHTQRAGYVITQGASRAEAVARAQQVVETVTFEVA
ncbi:MAG: ATP-grasp domain-containing protein [Gammaproteobacteria bacterium]|nr:ATP-grasp domain-containing protein [Gammaproteobacteria bacterium]MCF6230683.1 ATP-grasp domain-containing protein [Gammaproteobacteria bacterium]